MQRSPLHLVAQPIASRSMIRRQTNVWRTLPRPTGSGLSGSTGDKWRSVHGLSHEILGSHSLAVGRVRRLRVGVKRPLHRLLELRDKEIDCFSSGEHLTHSWPKTLKIATHDDVGRLGNLLVGAIPGLGGKRPLMVANEAISGRTRDVLSLKEA
jgi:hypothetical protein